MPITPTAPMHPFDVSRARAKWNRLCAARLEQKRLDREATAARMSALLHSTILQDAQDDWDNFNREDLPCQPTHYATSP
jgi:hypothetical protein